MSDNDLEGSTKNIYETPKREFNQAKLRVPPHNEDDNRSSQTSTDILDINAITVPTIARSSDILLQPDEKEKLIHSNTIKLKKQRKNDKHSRLLSFCLLMLGIGFLFPYNSVITAVDYFQRLYDPSIDFYFSWLLICPNFIILAYSVRFGLPGTHYSRIMLSLGFMIVFTVIIPLLNDGQELLLFGCTFLLGVFEATLQGSCYNLLGLLGPDLTSSFQTGSGFGGAIVGIIRLITKFAFAPIHNKSGSGDSFRKTKRMSVPQYGYDYGYDSGIDDQNIGSINGYSNNNNNSSNYGENGSNIENEENLADLRNSTFIYFGVALLILIIDILMYHFIIDKSEIVQNAIHHKNKSLTNVTNVTNGNNMDIDKMNNNITKIKTKNNRNSRNNKNNRNNSNTKNKTKHEKKNITTDVLQHQACKSPYQMQVEPISNDLDGVITYDNTLENTMENTNDPTIAASLTEFDEKLNKNNKNKHKNHRIKDGSKRKSSSNFDMNVKNHNNKQSRSSDSTMLSFSKKTSYGSMSEHTENISSINNGENENEDVVLQYAVNQKYKIRYSNEMKKTYQDLKLDSNSKKKDSESEKKLSVCQLWVSIWQYSLCVYLNYIVTLCLFPGVISLQTWTITQNDGLFPIIQIFLFNLIDTVTLTRKICVF